MTPAAARVAARGNGRQAAGTAAPIPAYPLAQVHRPHFMSSTNESRCTAATVTSFGHLPVPGRPGVYFIPHRLVQMDGAPCGVAAASAAAGTGRVASTASEAGRERLSQWTEEEAWELLAGPGTLVTRRRNVLSEAAAIAAGTDDLWGIVQTMSNAVGLIGLFDAVDLWVGVERDAPRVCGASAMGAGSVWLWLRVPDGAPVAEILSIGLTMRAGEQLLFGINERGQRVCAWSRTDADTYVPTPQPTAPPQAQATPKWGSPSCFPAAAAVTRADGSTAAMADVVVGDALRVAVAAAGDAGASRHLSALSPASCLSLCVCPRAPSCRPQRDWIAGGFAKRASSHPSMHMMKRPMSSMQDLQDTLYPSATADRPPPRLPASPPPRRTTLGMRAAVWSPRHAERPGRPPAFARSTCHDRTYRPVSAPTRAATLPPARVPAARAGRSVPPPAAPHQPAPPPGIAVTATPARPRPGHSFLVSARRLPGRPPTLTVEEPWRPPPPPWTPPLP